MLAVAERVDCDLRMRGVSAVGSHSGDYEITAPGAPCGRRSSGGVMHTCGGRPHRRFYRGESADQPAYHRSFRRCRNSRCHAASAAEPDSEMTNKKGDVSKRPPFLCPLQAKPRQRFDPFQPQ